ncbi:hypothetical protein QBC37DRAFT_377304 [Rhypophila decipiens]|uniref:Uncharacterized protein n=1 Tax=Rhypophila decipiens TaxID=261697 RepID=A0AAN6Y2S3_9PEZI|nr:hypothetical protein QBC37DRAFT_377304 [Rhypophila decipiens]
MASNNSNRGRGDISYGRTFNAGPDSNGHDDRDDNNSRSEPPVRLLDDAIEKLVHLRAGVSLIEQTEMEELMDCCDKLKRQVKSIDERLKAVEQAVSELKRENIAASSTSQQSETWASPTLSARQDSHKKPAKKKEEDKKWRLLGSFSVGSGTSPRSRGSADRGPPKPSKEQQQQQEGRCFGEGERWSVNDSPWRGKRAEWKGKERKHQDDEEGSGSGEDWV